MTNNETYYKNSTKGKPSSDGPPAVGGPGDFGTLPLGIDDFESPGEPQPYAFLKQLPLTPASDHTDAPFGFVSIHLRAFDAQGNPVPNSIVLSEIENWQSAWTWEVRETENEIRQACMGRWLAQSACIHGLTIFRVTNAEGQQFNQQLPAGKQSLHGEFMMQGFRVSTIRSIAINWVNQLIAGPQALPPPEYEEWDLVGSNAPATAFDRLRLDAYCNSSSGNNGSVHMWDHYDSKVKLRVSLRDQ